jgi:hypothetical protein
VCAGVPFAAVPYAAVDLAEHGFLTVAGEPCTPVSHILTAPNDTIESPVNRPITGVKASRLVIDSLFTTIAGDPVVFVIAYQPGKAFPDTLTRHMAMVSAAGLEFAGLRGKIHGLDHHRHPGLDQRRWRLR